MKVNKLHTILSSFHEHVHNHFVLPQCRLLNPRVIVTNAKIRDSNGGSLSNIRLCWLKQISCGLPSMTDKFCLFCLFFQLALLTIAIAKQNIRITNINFIKYFLSRFAVALLNNLGNNMLATIYIQTVIICWLEQKQMECSI